MKAHPLNLFLLAFFQWKKGGGKNPALEYECNMKKPSAESQVWLWYEKIQAEF